MNKKLLYDIAVEDGIYDCICDPYDKLKNGDQYSSVMIDLERFAEKIVRECMKVINDNAPFRWPYGPPEKEWDKAHHQGIIDSVRCIRKHFEVEE